jgi:acetyl esterase/lipase
MPSQPAPAWLPPTFGGVPKPEKTTDGVTRYNVRYAIIGGFRPLELDLYLPEGNGPFPVVVWVHGGGYTGGSRRDFTPWLEKAGLIEQVLAAGIAFVSVDYRLGYESVFPAAIHDLNSALRWLARHASLLKLDSNRFALFGESAGGHLASLTALTQGDKFFAGTNGVPAGEHFAVKALVDWYGASDLNTIVRPMDGTDASLPDLFRYPPEYFNLGAERWQDSQLRGLASPVNHVSASMPPTLRVHGTVDGMVPFSQSVEFHDAALLAGGRCELISVEGGDHAWFGLSQERVNQVVRQSVAFLATHLH